MSHACFQGLSSSLVSERSKEREIDRPWERRCLGLLEKIFQFVGETLSGVLSHDDLKQIK